MFFSKYPSVITRQTQNMQVFLFASLKKQSCFVVNNRAKMSERKDCIVPFLLISFQYPSLLISLSPLIHISNNFSCISVPSYHDLIYDSRPCIVFIFQYKLENFFFLGYNYIIAKDADLEIRKKKNYVWGKLSFSLLGSLTTKD